MEEKKLRWPADPDPQWAGLADDSDVDPKN